jgi:hypothetical protein
VGAAYRSYRQASGRRHGAALISEPAATGRGGRTATTLAATLAPGPIRVIAASRPVARTATFDVQKTKATGHRCAGSHRPVSGRAVGHDQAVTAQELANPREFHRRAAQPRTECSVSTSCGRPRITYVRVAAPAAFALATHIPARPASKSLQNAHAHLDVPSRRLFFLRLTRPSN